MITKGDVFKEIVSPKEVEKLDAPKMSFLIYKAVYMGIRLLLDIRHNQVRISKGETLELKVQAPASQSRFDKTKDEKKEPLSNPVIKDTDKVNVK